MRFRFFRVDRKLGFVGEVRLVCWGRDEGIRGFGTFSEGRRRVT